MKSRKRVVFARFFAVLFAVTFAVCQGPRGPAGPEGPEGPQGDPGEPGPQGDAGVSIVWKGELESAPDSAKQNWAYFNTADGNAYIYTDTVWEKLSQKGEAGDAGVAGADGTAGAAGDDGVSIDWRGTFNKHPTLPQLNWAYYNSTDKKSYIYDGNEWQVLAIDGVAGAQGPQGPRGANGTNGTSGGTGSQGPKGDNGANVYLVVFNSMGGEPAIDAVGVNHGSTVNALTFDPPAPAGQRSYIAGWYTDKDFNTSYNFSAPVTGNLTLYAKWALPAMLSEDVTVNGSFWDYKGEVWYLMAVTSGVRYNVYWGDRTNGGGTGDVMVAAYYRSNGEQIFDSNNSSGHTFTAASNGTVEIRVYLRTGGSGTFTIQYGVVAPLTLTYGPNVLYGGETYQTVVIGTQTWFARNLNYDVPGVTSDVCYDNEPSNCATYGRLYDWATAMNIDASYNVNKWNGSDVNHQGVCPVGWHVPSDADWTMLMLAVGGSSTVLKSSTGWNSSNVEGTDDVGFSALPGGNSDIYSDGRFESVGYLGCWWSTTEYDPWDAWRWNMQYDHGAMIRGFHEKAAGLLSVRCVQD